MYIYFIIIVYVYYVWSIEIFLIFLQATSNLNLLNPEVILNVKSNGDASPYSFRDIAVLLQLLIPPYPQNFVEYNMLI